MNKNNNKKEDLRIIGRMVKMNEGMREEEIKEMTREIFEFEGFELESFRYEDLNLFCIMDQKIGEDYDIFSEIEIEIKEIMKGMKKNNLKEMKKEIVLDDFPKIIFNIKNLYFT